jgi:hypothetical protein
MLRDFKRTIVKSGHKEREKKYMKEEKEGKWDMEERDKYTKLQLFSVDSQSDNLHPKDWH